MRRLKTRGLFVLFFFIALFHLQGQFYIQGQVRSQDHQKLVDATIICRTEENKIHSYTISRPDGTYNLSVYSEGTYSLEFSSLGFSNKTVPFRFDALTKKISKLDVILDKKSIELKEVILIENRPVLIKKDTIVFDAKYFTRGNEQNVEALLKNIPNIHVDSEGRVKIGNVEIEKVMIEGDDFFKKDYTMITKNMPSAPIDKVEIINNYMENPLLKGIKKSNKIALNLKLHESSKRIWFGNLQGGYGISPENSYDSSAILMNFGKINKYYFLGDLNTVGRDSKVNTHKLISDFDAESPTFIGDQEHAFKLVSLNAMPTQFKKKRTNFNKTELVSLNSIFNPGHMLKITANGFINWDDNTFFRRSMSIINAAGSNFSNTEVYKLNKTNSIAWAKLDFAFKINDNELLEASINLLNNREYATADLVFNNVASDERLSSEHKLYDARINYTKRIKKDKVFLVTARHIEEIIPQEYHIHPFNYSALFPQLTKANSISQHTKDKMQFWGIEANVLNRWGEGNLLEIQIGNGFRQDHLLSVFSLRASDITFVQPKGFQNNLEFNTNDLYLKSSFRHEINSMAFTGKLGFHQIYNSFSSAIDQETQTPFFVNPAIGMEWTVDDDNTFRAVYSYNMTKASVIDTFGNYLLSGFRTFKRGSGRFNQMDAKKLIFTYQFGNWSDKFFAGANAIYLKNHDYFSSITLVDQNYLLTDRALIDDRVLFNFSTNLDYFIKAFSSNIKTDFGLSRIRYMNIVNNSQPREITFLSYNYGLQLRSGFLGKLNFHIGTKWTTHKLSTPNAKTFTDNISFADLSFIFNKDLNIELRTARYYFGNLSKNDKNYYFLDFDLRYSVNEKLSISLSGNNLFNTRRFGSYSMSEIENTTTEYSLLPRIVLLKLKYRFGFN